MGASEDVDDLLERAFTKKNEVHFITLSYHHLISYIILNLNLILF